MSLLLLAWTQPFLLKLCFHIVLVVVVYGSFLDSDRLVVFPTTTDICMVHL